MINLYLEAKLDNGGYSITKQFNKYIIICFDYSRIHVCLKFKQEHVVIGPQKNSSTVSLESKSGRHIEGKYCLLCYTYSIITKEKGGGRKNYTHLQQNNWDNF